MRLQTHFLFGLAAILVCFSAFAAVSVYYSQVKVVEDNAYNKANIVMTTMEATREYVRKTLRPAMYKELDSDEFLIEAMSSSYVSRAIAEHIETIEQPVSYRRVALNSRNPEYEANQEELEMIYYFRDNPEEVGWYDTVDDGRGGEKFVRYQPVVMEASCLYCHGKREDAPPKIIELYGDSRGFDRGVGDVIGVVSVSLPIEINILKTKEMALTVFLAVVPAIIFLYAIISVFFNKLVSGNLRNVLHVFRKSLKDEKGVQLLEQSQTMDEIGTLNDMAVKIANHMQKNHVVLERYASELYRSKSVLQSVFDGIADPVVLLNQRGDLQIVNKAFLASYGLAEDDMLVRNIYDLDGEIDCPIRACREVLESMGNEPVSREVKFASGRIFQVYFYPAIHGEFSQNNIVCYVNDITEKKKMESHIQYTEKIISMGQVAAGVAHEINNPLGVILCHIDFIRDDEHISDESRNDLAIIEKHVDNCRRIVADLLRFSKPSADTKELYNINDIVLSVVSMMSNQLEKRNIRLITEFTEDLPDLYFDVDRFKQVVLNLILNSAYAIDAAGSACEGHIILRSQELSGNLILEVEDNGAGVPEDVRDNIFEPFFTTKGPGEGSGLGLAVSYGIIRNHNGFIHLKRSEKTCFTISIPIAENLHEQCTSTSLDS